MGGRRPNDLTGKQFGRLTVIECYGAEHGHTMWLCQCSCGRQTIARGTYLVRGQIISCGECERIKPNDGSRVDEIGSISLARLKGETDPYQHLASAIVAVAADDYRTAMAENDESAMRNLERFFNSDWYKVLTNVEANVLLRLLYKEQYENAQRVYI